VPSITPPLTSRVILAFQQLSVDSPLLDIRRPTCDSRFNPQLHLSGIAITAQLETLKPETITPSRFHFHILFPKLSVPRRVDF